MPEFPSRLTRKRPALQLTSAQGTCNLARQRTAAWCSVGPEAQPLRKEPWPVMISSPEATRKPCASESWLDSEFWKTSSEMWRHVEFCGSQRYKDASPSFLAGRGRQVERYWTIFNRPWIDKNADVAQRQRAWRITWVICLSLAILRAFRLSRKINDQEKSRVCIHPLYLQAPSFTTHSLPHRPQSHSSTGFEWN